MRVKGTMANSKQVLQDKMAMSRASRVFGVDTAIAPPRTGGGGRALCCEYSLHFPYDPGAAGIGGTGNRLASPTAHGAQGYQPHIDSN